MKSEGECGFCKKVFSGTAMGRHLQSCKEKAKARISGGGKSFLIKAAAGPFWVYFEADASSTLGTVDSFLRDLWLECCGHLSAFHIGGVTYASEPQQEYDDKSMDVKLDAVLMPGQGFSHEYDFGTTTNLNLKCLSDMQGKTKGGIRVIARNKLPEINCGICNKPAKEICSQCAEKKEPFLCAACAKKHECGEEMLLPVVNLPRMGTCGYCG